MITRIIDVAHTVATYRIPAGPHHDLSAAHQAVATGLDADPTAELLYRDWMRLEAARGNRSADSTPRSPACNRSTETWTAHWRRKPPSSSTNSSMARARQHALQDPQRGEQFHKIMSTA
jgi:hypothetical protein